MFDVNSFYFVYCHERRFINSSKYLFLLFHFLRVTINIVFLKSLYILASKRAFTLIGENIHNNYTKSLLITFILAFLGGFSATFIHLPNPWLLGPMIAVVIGHTLGLDLYWPKKFREIGNVVVGYSIGLGFTREALKSIIHHLPSIVMMTTLLIAFCFLLAFFISKISRQDYPSVLLGFIPGGLTQMIVLAEETKGINLSLVSFLQVTRLTMVFIFIPFIVLGTSMGGMNEKGTIGISFDHLFPEMLLFIPIVILFTLLFYKWRMPTPALVGPIIGTAILVVIGVHGPEVPTTILDFAQLLLGAYFGMLIKMEQIENKAKMTGLAIFGGAILLLGSYGLSTILTHQKHIPLLTSILSLAPGGMDQIGIIATVIGADLSIIASYQLFRLFFIFFALPPLLKAYIGFWYKRKKFREKKLGV